MKFLAYSIACLITEPDQTKGRSAGMWLTLMKQKKREPQQIPLSHQNFKKTSPVAEKLNKSNSLISPISFVKVGNVCKYDI